MKIIRVLESLLTHTLLISCSLEPKHASLAFVLLHSTLLMFKKNMSFCPNPDTIKQEHLEINLTFPGFCLFFEGGERRGAGNKSMLRLYKNLTSHSKRWQRSFLAVWQNIYYTAVQNNPDLFHQVIAIE